MSEPDAQEWIELRGWREWLHPRQARRGFHAVRDGFAERSEVVVKHPSFRPSRLQGMSSPTRRLYQMPAADRSSTHPASPTRHVKKEPFNPGRALAAQVRCVGFVDLAKKTRTLDAIKQPNHADGVVDDGEQRQRGS